MSNSITQLIKKINRRGYKDLAWRLILYARSLGTNNKDILKSMPPIGLIPDIIFSNNEVNKICNLVTNEQKKIVIDEADNILHNRLLLFNGREYDFSDKIDWHFESAEIKSRPKKIYEDSNTNPLDFSDVRVIWELNRHKHFVTLGKAYNYTKNIKYYEEFVRQLTDWLEENPYGVGVNWTSTMEVAMRTISWIWAYLLFRSIPQFSELASCFLKAIFLHGKHIYDYRSEHLHSTNHIIGEAAALYLISVQLPFLDKNAKWRLKAKQIIEREVKRQFYIDGGSKEQSFSYQRFVLNLMLQVCIFSKKIDDKFSDNFETMLVKMAEFMMYSIGPNNELPMIGDSDGARGLPLISNKEFWVEKDIFCLGAALFGRGEFKFFADEFTESAAWMLGDEGYKQFCSIEEEKPKILSTEFRESGYVVMRDSWNKGLYMLLDAGRLGIGKVAGHGHSDLMSFIFSAFNKSIIIDPGTYTYSNKNKYRNYFRSTFAHNTLVVDDKPMNKPLSNFDWDKIIDARVIRWLSNEDCDIVETYHCNFDNIVHKRKCVLTKGKRILIYDTLDGKGTHKIDSFIHLSPTVDILGISRKNIMLKTDDVYVTIYQENDCTESKIIKDVFSYTYGELIHTATIISTTKISLPATLITVILPTLGSHAEPSPSKMKEWIEAARHL